jgi:hypothetical protein
MLEKLAAEYLCRKSDGSRSYYLLYLHFICSPPDCMVGIA